MADYKNYLGILAIVLGFASYGPYFWSIYKGKTKPHAFTWFVWGTLTGIGFAAMALSGAGAGAWEMAFNSLLCFAVAGIAFWQRHIKYVLFDWLALCGALLGLVLWWLTDNPLSAVVLISISDTIGFLPTYRKVYYHPEEETALPWVIGVVKYIVILFALNSFTITTWLYPAVILTVDSIFVVLMLVRQKNLQK